MDLDDESGGRATRKKSLVRHENSLRRDGDLRVRHVAGNEAVAYLPSLFEQHVARWGDSSIFKEAEQRDFYRRLCLSADNDWLRFTAIEWDRRVIALHLGSHHEGRFLWYKPTYDLSLARRSPGEVLLRQLILRAMEEGARVFDFGLGDEAFKQRFATGSTTVRNWGLYRPSALERA
jgi:CelD/BcsL family acetyltransferase involved in cellulose biosynthesis